MSIGEIIAILALLIAIFQTMIAWMSHEGIRLSLSAGDWIRLFMILMASALIVGGLFEASGEFLLVFFISNFLITELAFVVFHGTQRNGLVFLRALFSCLYILLIIGISGATVMSHVCMIRSVLDLIRLSKCRNQILSLFETAMFMITLTFNLFPWLNLLENINTRAIVRLINWLACGTGVCLGYWFRLIFV